MDLALSNLQWLICHQYQPTNQPAGVVVLIMVLIIGQIELFKSYSYRIQMFEISVTWNYIIEWFYLLLVGFLGFMAYQPF